MRSKLYVIGPPTGPVKIGISTSPETRLVALQTACPYKLSVLCEMPGAAFEEAAVHSFFAEYRLEGEWFKRAREVLDFVSFLSSGIPVPLAIERLHEARTPIKRRRHAAAAAKRPSPVLPGGTIYYNDRVIDIRGLSASSG